jgi:menaquinone-dependent protoporphyrinogen oxidase
MASKVLVTAASRHQATHEIAEAIAGGLRERGVDAELRRVEEVTSLQGYRAVVLGSAVYMNRWLGEARHFASLHTSELCSIPVWLFSSGPLGPPDHLIPPNESADVPVLMRLTRAVDHRTFGGRLEMRHLHFAERALARGIHAPEEDCRDWNAIDRFAGDIADELLGAPMAASAAPCASR